MIVVTAFARVRPETNDTAREALLRAQAEALKEDGCESYRYYTAVDDNSSFVAVENWRDVAALQAHLGTPHVAELIGALTDILVEPLDIRAYDATRVDLG